MFVNLNQFYKFVFFNYTKIIILKFKHIFFYFIYHKKYFMKQVVIITVLIFLNIHLFAQTFVANKEEVSGTWTTSGSPYIILGEAIVPEGKTLNIEAGVTVKFKTGTERDYRVDYDLNPDFNLGFLRVNGTIKAVGKKDNFIVFTRNDPYDNWGVVLIKSDTKKSVLKYCKFEYAYHVRYILEDDNATGAISINNCFVKIQNCLIVNNGWTGINCKKAANPKITNCVVYKNEYGLECNSGSVPVVDKTIIWANETAFYINNASEPKFKNCLLQGRNFPDDSKDKGGNIMNKNPLFTNPLLDDFSLQAKSPCKKLKMGI